MTPPEHQRPSDNEVIEATAAAWLAQRDDSLTPEDELAFSAWRAVDPRHEAAVARLECAWAALQPLRAFRPEAARHPDPDLLAVPGKMIVFPGRFIAVAAAAAAVLMAGWWSWRAVDRSAPMAVHVTTVGGYERVMLNDGSVLELNGDSLAEVRFSPLERRVRLARGEAHFTVSGDPARPFWVEAEGVVVRAVGTAFNVRVGRGEVEVLVTEGKVSVTEGERVVPAAVQRGPAPPDQASPPSNTLLAANERAVISTARPAARATSAPPVVERIAPEALREALAWQGLRLVFVDTPLAEVVAQFNRRNAMQLVLTDPALATLPVGGSFRAENVEAFVRLLESGGDVVVDCSHTARVLLQRAK